MCSKTLRFSNSSSTHRYALAVDVRYHPQQHSDVCSGCYQNHIADKLSVIDQWSSNNGSIWKKNVYVDCILEICMSQIAVQRTHVYPRKCIILKIPVVILPATFNAVQMSEDVLRRHHTCMVPVPIIFKFVCDFVIPCLSIYLPIVCAYLLQKD